MQLFPKAWFRHRRFLGVGSHVQLPHCVQLSHLDAGGVIDGHWTFSSSQPFHSDASTFPSFSQGGRRLRHIINQATTVPYSAIMLAPKAEEKDIATPSVLNWNRPLPQGGIDQPVLCPSVFVSTGWVKRRLSVSERMSAYDVPTEARPLLCELREEEQTPGARPISNVVASSPCAFSQAPPLKLLQRALECWLPQGTPFQYDASGSGGGGMQPQGITGGMDTQPQGISMYGPAEEELDQREEYRISTKADDAETPVELWDGRIWERFDWCSERRLRFRDRFQNCCPLDSIRAFLLCRWRRNVTSGLLRFLQLEHGKDWTANRLHTHPDVVVGRGCLKHCAGADWWEWRHGSSLFFWRWPETLRSTARDGHPIWIKGHLPSYKRLQRREPNAELRGQVRQKLENVRRKGYIEKGEVKSLTNYFAVPKGKSDIRMVYDATKSRLNDALWVPSFSLPSIDSLLNLLDNDSWMGDLDMGEMFLNFPLDIKIRPYCGIDLRPYLDPDNSRKATWWEAWTRCMMGLMSSPYVCIKAALLADEVVRGDHGDESNPFHWA